MQYSPNLKEFVDDVKSGNVDIGDFFHKVVEEACRINKKYHAFITLREDTEVLEDALSLDKFEKKKLPAVPLSVKDNICTKGVRTTAGSKILHNYVPFFDATVVLNLKAEGCILIGKTAMDEFGFGTFSTNCAFDVPKNPHDINRVTGGSSGGAACVTALTQYPQVALAQSTGGSISCPAAFCGVVGLTPTYGVVSRYGLIDYANSMDKIGLIAKRVEDLETPFEIISKHDPRDSTSVGLKREKHRIRPNKLRVGIVKEYFDAVQNEKVKSIVFDAVSKLEREGVQVKEVSLPSTKYALAAYYIVATAEASTNLAKFCGMRYGYEENPEGKHFDEYFSNVRSNAFGDEAKRRILLGTFARMAGYRDAYYLRALRIRRMIINEFKKALDGVDVLLAPTMPTIAPKFDEAMQLSPAEVYAMDVLTVAPNFAGVPHLSLPCGRMNGMPLGIHLIGGHFDDWKLIEIGKVFEEVLDFK